MILSFHATISLMQIQNASDVKTLRELAQENINLLIAF